MSDSSIAAHLAAPSKIQRAPTEGLAAACLSAEAGDMPVHGKRAGGMTIIEVVIAIAILGILASISIPLYNDYRYHAMVAQAKSDIATVGFLISHFEVTNGEFPESLGDIGKAGLRDPWGNDYAYLNLVTLKGNGHARKDKNLVPINSDYDLYSKGKDGKSVSPLTAKVSRDDIIRASNGRFVGLASDY